MLLLTFTAMKIDVKPMKTSKTPSTTCQQKTSFSAFMCWVMLKWKLGHQDEVHSSFQILAAAPQLPSQIHLLWAGLTL